MKSKWVISNDLEKDQIDRLIKELGIPPILARILLARGIDNFDKAQVYFRPDLEKLHDPYLMKDMDKAVDRLTRAFSNGEKILVYGDYDVDGISGCTILYQAFSKLVGNKVTYHIPDRIKEGYGLSIEAVDRCVEEGISLIVTVDCGVTAVEEVAYAREKNIEVVICDHHEPGDSLPEAVAILDPKRPDCPYPFKELAGVGVGFKLLSGLYKSLDFPQSQLDEFLDLVAIGSCADIVPLVDENRILVRHGLDKINYNPRFGIKALLSSSGAEKREITSGLVVFVLAPRINAVGRMGDATRAVRLLSAPNLTSAQEMAREIEKENQVRRNVDESTFKEAVEIVESRLDPANDNAFVVYKEDWHPGVIGIVASRIVEKYYRPAILISVVDGVGKASARSISAFNIYEAIRECSDHLLTFGGHKYAAGLSIKSEQIPAFVEQFKAVADRMITDEDLVPEIHIDCEVELNQFDERLLRLLKLMGPFGPSNLRPVFCSRNLKVVSEPQVVGKNHLKLSLEQKGTVLTAIGFNMGDRIDDIFEKSGVVDAVYVLEENVWNGRKELQMRLKDIR
ncbi:MAG TPA: single-stranded-DNA-specific exonuclease RecJ [Calditrichia bacterium]|nr:single-stranded-DNA-specific exonuclease RecJ [Calditrichota bacterium]HQV30565.1 single-stranded-DNA-specific exonuclease RecJ [Calditrichia bacterium]